LPGQKLAQSVHCAFSFAQEHNDLTNQWMSISNYICVLEIEEDKLNQFIEKLLYQNIKFSIFKEPDMDNRITSIAIEPGIVSKKLCSNLKLAK
jgi:hypothetical protein